MQSLVIVIILLSLIGVYINLGTVSELNVPEFNKSLEDKSLEDNSLADKNVYHNKGMSVDDISHHIREQTVSDAKYDAIGNNLVDNIKDGLTPGEELINLKVQKGFAPNTRPSGAGTRPSSTVIGPYGLSKSNLSYKNNFPYEEKYLADVSASAKSNSIQNSAARNPKATPYIGEMVLPQDESRFKEDYSYTNRAYAIVRNQIANQNKNLLNNTTNEKEISNRGSKKIYRVTPDEMYIKDKPNLMSIKNKIDENSSKEKSNNKHNEISHFTNVMKNNYNFK
tara:strand:- start:20606 stop:21448 length:843 start_codon:yes stop_codon:yes gene_type:complete